MRYLLILGPLLSFVLAVLVVPIADFATKLVYACGAVIIYGVFIITVGLAFPKLRQKRNGLWLAISVSFLVVVIAFLVANILTTPAS